MRDFLHRIAQFASFRIASGERFLEILEAEMFRIQQTGLM